MKFVPLIPSSSVGPLGVKHLPRLWLKVSLHLQDKLAEGYHAVGPGFDSLTLKALGIEQEAFENYIAEERPTYFELEAWILKHYGPKLNPRKIAAHNRIVDTYQHDEETRALILDEAGISDDGTMRTALVLNDIDDWSLFHKQVLE